MTDQPPSAPVTTETIAKDFADALSGKIETKNLQTPVDKMRAMSEETDFVVEYLLANPGQEAVILAALSSCFKRTSRERPRVRVTTDVASQIIEEFYSSQEPSVRVTTDVAPQIIEGPYSSQETPTVAADVACSYFEAILTKNIILKLAARARGENNPPAATAKTPDAVDMERRGVYEDFLGSIAER